MFSLEILKKLMLYVRFHIVLKMFVSNTYEFEIPWKLGINQVFKVENMTPCHTPLDYPAIISNLFFTTLLGPLLYSVHPPPPPSRRHYIREIRILWLIVVGGYRWYLVWRMRPESICIWSWAEDIMHLNSYLLDDHFCHSPETNV